MGSKGKRGRKTTVKHASGRAGAGDRTRAESARQLRFRTDVIEGAAQGSAKVRASFHEIERAAEAFVGVYGAVTSTYPQGMTADSLGATPLEQLQVSVAFFQIPMGKRVAELLLGIITSLNARKLGLAALSTRALLEVTAVITHTETKVRGHIEKDITAANYQEVVRLLEDPIRGGRFDWETLLESGPEELLKRYRDDPKTAKLAQQVNVQTRIEQLDDRFAETHPETKGSVLFAYDLLSDICHPSVGAHIVYVGERDDGLQGFDSLPSDHILRLYCLSTTTRLVELLAELDRQALSSLSEMAGGLREA